MNTWFLFVSITLALTLSAPANATPFAYISNSVDGSVSVIDVVTNRVVSTVEVGASPYGVAVNSDGTRVYITNRDDGTVSVLDGTNQRVITTVGVGRQPSGVAVNGTGRHVYVANMDDPGSVSVIDTVTNAVVATVPVGRRPLGVAFDVAGAKIYVGSTFDDAERRPCSQFPILFCDITVTVIDGNDNQVVNSFPVGDHLAGLATSQDGRVLYVANQFPVDHGARGGISVVNLLSSSREAKIAVDLATPLGVAVHPTQMRAYTAAGDSVHVVDTITNSVMATIPAGAGAAGLSLTPGGERLYVANTNAGTVSVIDTELNAVIATVIVGEGPVAFGQFIQPPPTTARSPTPTGTLPFTPTPDACGGVCDGRFCSIAGIAGNCLSTVDGCACAVAVTPTSTTPVASPTPTSDDGSTPTIPKPACLGDCNGDKHVTIDELITAVRISLDTDPLEMCRACDGNMDGRVTIEELVKAVANALNLCSP